MEATRSGKLKVLPSTQLPSALDDAINLLINWKLPQLRNKFRDEEICTNAFEHLTEAEINELIPKMGPRLIFRARLSEWLRQKTEQSNQVENRKRSFQTAFNNSNNNYTKHPNNISEEPIVLKLESVQADEHWLNVEELFQTGSADNSLLDTTAASRLNSTQEDAHDGDIWNEVDIPSEKPSSNIRQDSVHATKIGRPTQTKRDIMCSPLDSSTVELATKFFEVTNEAEVTQDSLNEGREKSYINCSNSEHVLDTVTRMEYKIDVINEKVAKILIITANLEKRTMIRDGTIPGTVTPAALEDFSEFESLLCKTVDDLMSFEANLGMEQFFDKFFRFISTQFELSGKRDGGMIFRTIIRRFMVSSVFVTYSWKGQSRTKKEDKKNSEPVSLNSCFKSSYPNFVRLMFRICSAADLLFTMEKTEEEFCKVLRFKNKILQRNTERNNASIWRKSSSRSKSEKI